MNLFSRIESYLVRFPPAALILYASIVTLLLATTWNAIAAIVAQRDAVAAANDMLSQLEGRDPSHTRKNQSADGTQITGSPFLEGPTVTVAGAALLQRVSSAVARVGGNTLSSQVELQGTQAQAGFISVLVSCEVEQPALQKLLYDVEAGMPYLFVDRLVAQAPATAVSSPDGKLRVLIGISGRWKDTK